LFRRRHVGKDVRPTETVDRLLGIADKKNRRVVHITMMFLEKYRSQNAILYGIGVLKLINQGGPVFSPDSFRQEIAFRLLECISQSDKQVVEKENVSLGFVGRKFGSHRLQKFFLQG